jgi:hypothetical protein
MKSGDLRLLTRACQANSGPSTPLDDRVQGRGLTGQNRKKCLSAENLSSPLSRPFSCKLLIRLEI